MTSPTQRQTSLIRLAGPLVFSFWFRSAFQWVDTIYASSLGDLGDASIAAIGLAAPLEFLMIACWVGLSNGLTGRLAAAMGARQGDKIEQLLASTRQLVSVLRWLFLAFACAIFFAAKVLPLDPDVAMQFGLYGPLLLGGSALTSFWSIVPDSIVKAHNDTRSTMWAGVISTLLNFALNTLFVFVFHWGILGIAGATVLARLGGLAYALRRARHHERKRLAGGLDTVPGVFEKPRRRLLTLAIPASMSFALLALEGMAINGFLAAQENAGATLAAWSIVDRAGRFLVMPVVAVGVALLPLTARLWGAGDVRAVGRELRTGLWVSIGYALVFAAPLTLWLGPWVAESLTDSPQAQKMAGAGLSWVWLLTLLGGPMFLLRACFDGMQHPRPGLITSLLRTFVLILPLGAAGFLLGPGWGLPGVIGLLFGVGTGAGLASLGLGLWMARFLGQARAQPELR